MKLNIIRIAIASAFVILLFVTAKIWTGNNNTEQAATQPSGTDFIEFETGVSYQVFPYENSVLMINNEGIQAVNKNGDYTWNIAAKYSYPFVSLSGRYILHADRGGRDFGVYVDGKQSYSIKTDENIITGKVNKNGFSVIATEETGYKGLITVYNHQGHEVYKWHCGEGFIVDADISPNNTSIAVARILSDSETVNSHVMILNILTDDMIAPAEKTDSIVSCIRFNRDGSVVCLSDNELFGIDSSGREKFSIDFKSSQISGFNLDSENCLVLAFINSKNNTNIDIYSKEGKKRGSYQAAGVIKNLSVSGDVILASQMRTVLRIAPNGKAQEVTTVSHDIRNLQIYNNRNQALVVGGSTANVINTH